MEGIDARVWTYIRDRADFVRFTEMQNALRLPSQKLTTVLRRLERVGEVFVDIGFYKRRPVNMYLAIDADNQRFRARIVDDHGGLFVIFEWLDDEGRAARSISTVLGEIADYVTFQRDGKGVLLWPAWVRRLEETGRFRFEEFLRGAARRPAHNA